MVAFCIFHNEAYFDGLRLSEILGSGTSAFCEEMAAKDFAGAKLAVPITTVVSEIIVLPRQCQVIVRNDDIGLAGGRP